MSSPLDTVTVFPVHDGAVYTVCQYKDYILTGGHDKIIRIWDCNEYKLINKIIAHDHMIRCICIGEDQGIVYIISGSWDNTVKFFDFGSNAHIYTMDQHNSRVRCAISIPNHSELSIGAVCISGADDGSIICTSMKCKSVLYKIKPHNRFVLCLDYKLNLKSLFVSGSADMNLIFQSIEKGELLKIINVGKSITSVLFVPYKDYNLKFGHDLLCCGTFDSYVIVYDIETAEIIYSLHGNDNIACVCLHSSLVTVRDKTVIFIYSIFKDGTMNCWNLDDGLPTFTEYYLNEQLLGTNLLSIAQEKIGAKNIEYQLNSVVNCSKLSGSGSYFACGTDGLMFCVRYNFSAKINSVASVIMVEENNKLLHSRKKYAEIIVVPELKKTIHKHESSISDLIKSVNRVGNIISDSPKSVNVIPSSSLTLSKYKRIRSQLKTSTIPPNIVLAQESDANGLRNSLLSQVKKEFDRRNILTYNQSHLRNTAMPSRSSKILLHNEKFPTLSHFVGYSKMNDTCGKSKSMNLFEKSRGGIIDTTDLQVANTFGTNSINYRK